VNDFHNVGIHPKELKKQHDLVIVDVKHSRFFFNVF